MHLLKQRAVSSINVILYEVTAFAGIESLKSHTGVRTSISSLSFVLGHLRIYTGYTDRLDLLRVSRHIYCISSVAPRPPASPFLFGTSVNG